ncbi:MAG: dimethylsulfoniopropionate demethylase [SAR324 cluster bacterium]|nr:dimethylsulfoniopropionate demethylase [SAR324 cluster bacterium]MBL7034548.1 dimethylsulfoniopropionate demethylase [SAR324 cluster bacterium]
MCPELSISTRTRTTPFNSRVEACGVKAYMVYNHMLLPVIYRSLEEDYWHLCEAVQVWDVSCQRQVEIRGTEAQQLVQLMTPRDLSNAQVGQCFYAPLCDESGGMINDPILIKHSDNHWWLSIADSDVKLWAKGLATGFGLDAQVSEPDIWPLAVQGPKAEELISRVFGEEIRKIGFFRSRMLNYQGTKMLVARSGWSKQGGFEIYVNDMELGGQLWDELFAKGEDLNVGPGSPNLIERIESGLLSFGGDMGYDTTPFECGLDRYVSLDADIKSLSLKALKTRKPKTKLIGLVIDQQVKLIDRRVFSKGEILGEITSDSWSPRYSVHLVFAKCELSLIAGREHVELITSTGEISAVITELPFDFNLLGLRGLKNRPGL